LIYTIAMTKELKLIQNEPLSRLVMDDIKWYWVDFEESNAEEELLLSEYFKFNNLAIEDCLNNLERPKVDYYDTYNFFVLNAMKQETLEPVEVNMFVGESYIVSFHKTKLNEINKTRQKVIERNNIKETNPAYVAYLIMDKIVDMYFPEVYRIEDSLNDINFKTKGRMNDSIIDKVFDLRTDLLKQRYIVNSMKELLYRIINSSHFETFGDSKRYFNDIYDHLLKLSDIIESNRELTVEIRENYMSINSYRMNKIMTVLTLTTTVFIPLTFIAGIYGMNFEYMPELKWRYGYFFVIGIMVFIGLFLFRWFKRKGWFD